MRLSAAAFACLAAAAVPGTAWAQGGAECATVECARTGGSEPSPDIRRLWDSAASARAIKLEFVDAVRAFAVTQAAPDGGDGAVAATQVAAIRSALSRWDAAIQALEAAARPHLRAAETSIVLGTVYLDRYRIGDAVRALTEASRLDPDRADVQVSLALAYGLEAKAPEASRAWRTAASLDARNGAVAYSLARTLTGTDAAQARQRFVRLRSAVTIPAEGKVAPAAPFERAGLFREVPGIAPLFALSPYAKAFGRVDAGDYASAVEELAGTVARGAPISEEHRRALTAWVAGDHNAALRDLRRAIELRPGDERARLALAFVLREAGRPSEAEQVLRDTIAAFPASGLPWYRLGQLLESQSRLPDAARAFEESLARSPILGRDALYQRLARLRVNQADFDGAIAAYAARLSINPNGAEAHRSLGEIYYLQGRDDDALGEFLVAVWLDPNDARALAALGKVHVRAGRYGESLPALRRAVALDASRADAHYALGQALARQNRADESRQEMAAFQRLDAAERERGQRDFRLEQTRVEAGRLLASGDIAAALQALAQLRAEDPENPRWMRELGAALLRGRYVAEAIASLEAAQDRSATVEGARLLADAYAAAGRADDARQQQARYDGAMREARLAQLANPETGP
jgi:tetratricopeptide (TPR) repeat protein